MQINWNIVNAIGGWLCGIATAIGTYFAWKQYQQNNSKQLKLKVDYQLLFLHSIFGSKYIGNQLILKIINTGNTEVMLTGWGINTKKVNLAFIQMLNTTVGGANLPVTVKPKACETLSILTTNLYNELGVYVNKDLLSKKSKLTFYVQDSFDKIYKIKTKITYKQIEDYVTIQKSNNF